MVLCQFFASSPIGSVGWTIGGLRGRPRWAWAFFLCQQDALFDASNYR
jgi:hypothetical protein